MKKFFLPLFALAAVAIVGCSKPADAPAEEKATTTTSTTTPASGASLANYTDAEGNLICPVKGNKIASAEAATGSQEFEGKKYYFCCQGCPEAFAKDPAKYAKK